MGKEEILNHVLPFYYGGQTRGELSFLYDKCIDKDVLELGSMVGMGGYTIASVAKSLCCVDLWSDNQNHLKHDPIQQAVYASYLPSLSNMYDVFINNCKEFINSGKIKMYRGNTLDMALNFLDKSFDIIFIDADHSYFGISSDYKTYEDKIKDDGIFIFHDYGDMWTGIKKFCDEMIATKKFKLIESSERIVVAKKCE
jgi:predicted O-methyltransferase YrrM